MRTKALLNRYVCVDMYTVLCYMEPCETELRYTELCYIELCNNGMFHLIEVLKPALCLRDRGGKKNISFPHSVGRRVRIGGLGVARLSQKCRAGVATGTAGFGYFGLLLWRPGWVCGRELQTAPEQQPSSSRAVAEQRQQQQQQQQQCRSARSCCPVPSPHPTVYIYIYIYKYI